MAALTAAPLLLAGSALGQGLGNSPYSRIGLGDFTGNLGGVRQLAMGGTGQAAPNTANINELNPALLVYTPRTMFEVGFNGQYKNVRNATDSYRVGSGTLGYLAFAVPINKRWAAAVGLKPYSAIDYEVNSTQAINGDPYGLAYKQYQGKGGLSEAYFAHGIHVLRDLNIGGSASFLFGTLDQSTGTAIQTSTVDATQQVVRREQLRYADFLLRAGIHYRHKISKDLNVNVGGTHTFQTNTKVSRSQTLEQRDANGAILAGTTVQSLLSDAGHTYIPALTQVGISVDNSRNFSVNLDGGIQQWSQFQAFGDGIRSPLSNTWRVAAGSEFTPDPGSVQHYFQRVTYRFGLSVAQMPYRPNGQVLYDRAIHWGFAFPLPTATALESTVISLALMYGVRGNTDYLYAGGGGSNVRENYIRGQLGVTLSNRWFIKRRLQ
ncbi:MAG: hypothetical protein EOO56_19895 [Hymenobacter sp.]|nr:MAG: hypothetical protein EOO56_19895 [Hymenobacter sp.]